MEASQPQFPSNLELYRPMIYKWAKLLARNPEDADDLCQEVCVHVLLGENSFRGEAEFSTWLYRITINVFNDSLRKKERKQETSESDTAPRIAEAKNWKEKSKCEPATIDRVQAALQHLRLRHRKILEWKYFAGLSHAEIAKLLCIKESSVSRSLYRARDAFKKQYNLGKLGNKIIPH